jgi:hypothetical protein
MNPSQFQPPADKIQGIRALGETDPLTLLENREIRA